MTKRIFRAICLVSLAVFLASVTLIMGILYDYFSRVQLDQLRIEAGLAARGVEENGADYFDGLDTQSYRITWIGADGTVLFDSTSDADVMENHLDREEVKQALASGYGHSSRYSSTLMERLLYSAQRLNDGSVIRLSPPGKHTSRRNATSEAERSSLSEISSHSSVFRSPAALTHSITSPTTALAVGIFPAPRPIKTTSSTASP